MFSTFPSRSPSFWWIASNIGQARAERALAARRRLHPSMKLHPAAPVVEEVVHCLLKRNLGQPAGLIPKLGCIRPEDLDVRWTQARRVDPNVDVMARVPKQGMKHLVARPTDARANVVDFARFASLQRKPVSSHGISYVGPVSLALEIAHINDWRLQTLLDLCDLLREGRGRE